MSFSTLPPEVNSTLAYTGPGSAPLLSAATGWDGLQADLTSTATSIKSVLSGLTESWTGPSSAALVSAITPLVTWLDTTAAQAGTIGQQAKAAAGLFETMKAAMVPPPVIAANRALLLALISTNFFGQNTPAIAATEAQYDAMWAQDGAGMDTYHAASQTNNSLAAAQQPSSPPLAAKSGSAPATTDPLGSFGNLQVPSWAQNILAHLLPQGTDLGDGTLGADASALEGLLSAGGSTAAGAGTAAAFQSIYYPLMLASLPARILPSLLMQMARMGSMGAMGATGALAGQAAGGAAGGTGTLMTQIGDFVNGKLHGAVGTLVGHFNNATSAISAKLGQAASMGSLKVPQGWAAAADGMVRAAPVLPHTTVSAPVQTMAASSGMPGGPFGNAMLGAMAGRGMGSVAAKAPKIIPKSPSGG